MKDPNEYNVRAVERALLILECFDDENPERGITDIAQVVGLHKATSHRIVTTLVNYGFLERAADGQRYRLGLELANLGFKVIRRMNLRHEALPYMKQLVNVWDETCDLSMFDDALLEQFEIIRDQGYAVDYEEFEKGICAVAAPIFNRNGKVIAAIGCPCPTSRMTPERITQIGEAFKETAQAISHRMGYDLSVHR
jgi:DNA-binding IclR family transcriptional regulator